MLQLPDDAHRLAAFVTHVINRTQESKRRRKAIRKAFGFTHEEQGLIARISVIDVAPSGGRIRGGFGLPLPMGKLVRLPNSHANFAFFYRRVERPRQLVVG